MAKKLDVLLIIDLEATCWEGKSPDGQQSEIIEIGITTLDVSSGQPLEKESILVRPLVSELSDFCQELTTITPAMLERDGVTLKAASTRLQKHYESKRRAWGSWGDYDRIQMERDCAAKGIGYPMGTTHINVKSLYALLSNVERERGMATALKELGIELEGTHHRGHDDAWNIAKIAGLLLRRSGMR